MSIMHAVNMIVSKYPLDEQQAVRIRLLECAAESIDRRNDKAVAYDVLIDVAASEDDAMERAA